MDKPDRVPVGDRCTADDCEEWGEARHDRYGIYAGRLCDEHWEACGIGDWVHDYADAGEYLEPEDY